MIATQASVTAKICSYLRAYHSIFARNKVFDDYLAYEMMGKEEYEQIEALIHSMFSNSETEANSDAARQFVIDNVSSIPLSRIRYAEEELHSFAARHGACQYVICGAGMDTFAFRNTNRDIQIYEIDHPSTQAYKLRRIAELEWSIPENVCYVPVNFECDSLRDALLGAGLDPKKKTFFSILGVTYYITLPVFEETLQSIAALSGEGSAVVFDYPDETTHRPEAQTKDFMLVAKVTASFGEVMRQGFSYRSLEAALLRHGFAVTEHMTPDRIRKAYFQLKNTQDTQGGQFRVFDNVSLIRAQAC